MSDTISAETILSSMRDTMRQFQPPPFDILKVGSVDYLRAALREKAPHDPRLSLPMTYAGFPVRVDPYLPKYMAVLIGQPRKLFGDPNIVIIDMRRRPFTSDMAQMLDDLVAAGAVRP